MTQHLTVGSPAPRGTVIDPDGNPVELASLWAVQPALLVFLRHFGCIFCRARLAQLEQHYDQFAALNVRVAAVGIGEPKHARRYGGQLAPRVQCLSTQATAVYDTFGLRKGSLMSVLNPSLLMDGARLGAQGFSQGAPTGDAAMNGGAFIIDSAGVVRYADVDDMANHQLDFPAMLTVARALAG